MDRISNGAFKPPPQRELVVNRPLDRLIDLLLVLLAEFILPLQFCAARKVQELAHPIDKGVVLGLEASVCTVQRSPALVSLRPILGTM